MKNNRESNHHREQFNRRNFLRQVAAWTAGLTVAPPLFKLVIPAFAGPPTRPLLAVGKGNDYEVLVTKVLEPLGGIGAFVKKGARVVVKPNIGWDRSPEQAANTHPLVVKSLVQSALKAGASRVMVFDRTCNEPRRCYNNSGIQAAVESLNDNRATCAFIDDRKFVLVRIENGQALSEWQFYKDAIEADCYINVPVAKHHGLTRLTLGLKNVMGVIGGNRGSIHQSIAQKLADLNTVVRTHLTVIDATRILLRGGPQGGNPDDVKELHTILATTDQVAADAYATTFFDLPPDALETTKIAAARGLGEMDLNKVKIVKV